ncbi:putative ABC transport system ATP-binding protein [Trichlorobacter thiogenes]|uniref:Putative ABC transport system ATP-binding protein n=1 Tax=Trichlorobacter thiogenes TaxID=115783 RepID=A0A1T4K838_9BACT|nr:ABC transporter ATP-binding protein [Trichlorobacter thiogenes]SJZ38576.1 putative ABC transport system ATP-binding protein [Trichlorobacter thiogenes]
MPEVIKLENIRRLFGEGDHIVEALRGVSFAISVGEFVAIMGASGSGKSTCMNTLGCLDKPTSGTYWLDGIDTAGMTADSLAEVRNKKLGFVFQGFNLLPRTTALENVELPLVYAGIPAAERHSRAKAALERVGLGDRVNHTSAQLSGGQQQRVAIARALVNQPAVILADEPTGNLDTTTTHEIMQLFTDLNQQGITIVMITHEPEVAEYASRRITFRDGSIISDTAEG